MTSVDLTEVLELVNAGRKAQGKRALAELPKVDYHETCPLMEAFGCAVGGDWAMDSRLAAGWKTPQTDGCNGSVMPEPLTAFARAFDNFKFPELVKS